MSAYKFIVRETPISKKRPRFITRKGPNGVFTRNVNIQQTEEGRFLWEVLTQWGEKDALTGPLKVKCLFVFKRPKSNFGTGRNANKLKDNAPKYCDKISKDLDNMEKFLLDSLNGYIYKDDRQVIELSSRKVWAVAVEEARTEFIISEV